MASALYIREARLTFTGKRRKVHPDSFREPAAVAAYLRQQIGAEAVEVFGAIALDGRHRPLAYYVVSRGTVTASLVHPREVFRPALMLGACALIVAHNHPSGDPEPSPEDISVTKRLADAGKLLGVPLLDSLVIAAGTGGYVSLRDRGIIRE
jgi:DNA repair protein RadC